MATSVVGAQDIGNTNVSVPGTGSTAGVSGGSITDTSGPTDHSVVLNRLGLRYFGPDSVAALSSSGEFPPNPMATTPPPTGTLQTVGVRYWLNSNLGLEGGLAFGVSSGSFSSTHNGTSPPAVDDPSFFGIGLRVGLPIAIAESKHLTISLVPYAAFLYGRSSITIGNMATTADVSLSTAVLRLGGSVQAELQFGFLGIPQLGLIAQFGLGLNYTNISYSNIVRANNDTRTASASHFDLGTSVGPGYGLAEIIAGSISAVYYFGNAPGSH